MRNLIYATPNARNQAAARCGSGCCLARNTYSAARPRETELSSQITTSTTALASMGVQAASAKLHTAQGPDYFMQRYNDVISSCGGKSSYDANHSRLLFFRDTLWAAVYALSLHDALPI